MPIKIVTHLDDPEDPSVHPPIRPILGCEFVERTQEDGRGSGVPPPSDRPPPFRLLSSDIVQCKRRSEVVRKRLQVGRVVSLHIRQFNPWDHRMPNVLHKGLTFPLHLWLPNTHPAGPNSKTEHGLCPILEPINKRYLNYRFIYKAQSRLLRLLRRWIGLALRGLL